MCYTPVIYLFYLTFYVNSNLKNAKIKEKNLI